MSKQFSAEAIKTIAIIGAGTIGAGWAAHFLRMGLDVVAWDPAPDAETRLRARVAQAWPACVELGLRDGASQDRLRMADTPEAAAALADFVQENAPEREDVKIPLLGRLDAAAPAHVVIATSTSGYPISDLVGECKQHPERLLVGHPFNPPYIAPLVEVVGGKQTSAELIDWTVAFYNHFGKYGLKCSSEAPGFVANRLQEAMWREALHMIANGMATVEEIDAAVAQGPGLRWAIFGPMMTYHLSGGSGGIANMLDHFDPAEFDYWSYLSAPPVTENLRTNLIEGCDALAAGRTISDIEADRDRKLIAILKALRS